MPPEVEDQSVVALLPKERRAVEDLTSRSKKAVATSHHGFSRAAGKEPPRDRDAVGRCERDLLERKPVVRGRRRETESIGPVPARVMRTTRNYGTPGREKKEGRDEAGQDPFPAFSATIRVRAPP
jgi:hypothetical protein